jgi:peptidoglycan/LPS O-acetylase OafA/YrhL
MVLAGPRGASKVSNMDARTLTAIDTQSTQSLYLPALDGLRFVAFLLVFIHHLPDPGLAVLRTVREFGWIGVELFFVISAFLFFHLFAAEHKKTGTISVPKFYVRRAFRIYPLMLAYPLAVMAMLAAIDKFDTGMLMQFLALAGLAQNMLTWVTGYATAIPWTSHLWTLSFEFQVYLLIPFAFVAFRQFGRNKLMLALCAVWLWAVALRAVFVYFEARHPIIWVTPFLRPESVLIGLALAIGIAANAKPLLVIGIAAVTLAILVSGPNVQSLGWWTLVIYPLAAMTAACLVWLGLNVRTLSGPLSCKPLRYLGTISYGLYVFHLIAIHYTLRALNWLGMEPTYGVVFLLSFVLTVTLAAASYSVLERPILKMKTQFSLVQGRS